eukprot:297846-Chlamydomonas_euryale.AAC.26
MSGGGQGRRKQQGVATPWDRCLARGLQSPPVRAASVHEQGRAVRGGVQRGGGGGGGGGGEARQHDRRLEGNFHAPPMRAVPVHEPVRAVSVHQPVRHAAPKLPLHCGRHERVEARRHFAAAAPQKCHALLRVRRPHRQQRHVKRDVQQLRRRRHAPRRQRQYVLVLRHGVVDGGINSRGIGAWVL